MFLKMEAVNRNMFPKEMNGILDFMEAFTESTGIKWSGGISYDFITQKIAIYPVHGDFYVTIQDLNNTEATVTLYCNDRPLDLPYTETTGNFIFGYRPCESMSVTGTPAVSADHFKDCLHK